jgi:long-chain acyl-CoA synthetase
VTNDDSGDARSGLLSNGCFTSLEDLKRRVAQASGVLLGAGVREGASVALLLRNGPTFVEALMAAQAIGAYPVPINSHFARPEILYVLEDCGATVLISDDDLYVTLAAFVPRSLKVFTTGGGDRSARSHTSWDAAVRAAPAASFAERSPTASMFYTSGTTGKPKGVRRALPTPEKLTTMAGIRARLYGFELGMRALLAAPLYHSAPNYFAVETLRTGGFLALQDKFDPEDTLRAIQDLGITHSFMVPTMFVRLLALPQGIREKYDLSTLRFVLHAGAPCPPHVKAAMIKWWGPVLNEYYGSTELGPLTFATSEEWLSHRGTVGYPVDGVRLEVRDEEGSKCPAGVPGEIFVMATPHSEFTYQGDDAKRAEMENSGGLASGDIGYRDADGYVHICDRRIDMIISGGVNIYPAEIEAALLEINGVADCAVFGLPDPEFGERVVGFIRCEPACALSSDALAEALRSRIAGYKVPREFHFRPELPRDENGKIYKRKLRDAYVEMYERNCPIEMAPRNSPH